MRHSHDEWWRIEAPYYVAAFQVETATGKVVAAAPIIRWMVGKSLETVVAYCDRKRFKLMLLDVP